MAFKDMAKVMNAELCGVDNDIGVVFEWFEKFSFFLDPSQNVFLMYYYEI